MNETLKRIKLPYFLLLKVATFLLLIPMIVSAQEIDTVSLEQINFEVIPLHNLDCSTDPLLDGRDGLSTFDRIYSLEACYRDFLNQGKDVNVCEEFSESEREFLVPEARESQTQICYRGFAIAKADYTVCDNLQILRDRSSCYMDVAVVSNNPGVCNLLSGSEKDTCFYRFTPATDFFWLTWFLKGISLYVLLSLIVYVAAIWMLRRSLYRRSLIVFSVAVAIVQSLFIPFLMIFSRTSFSTEMLRISILIPAFSLLLSAFIMKGWDLLLQKTQNKWLATIYGITTGFLQGFIVLMSAFLIGSRFVEGFAVIFMVIVSLISGGVFAVVYTLFSLWLVKGRLGVNTSERDKIEMEQ